MAKIYQFQDFVKAKNRSDWESRRHEPITMTLAELEDFTTDMIITWSSIYLGLDEHELAKCVEEVEAIVETEKQNT